MTVPRDPYLVAGPLPPVAPRDPNADTVLDESERGKDEMRGEAVDELVTEQSRPLTSEEKDAAKHAHPDEGRTYAPASARVAKPPAPGDDDLIEEGRTHPVSPEAARHPGDRSDPGELR
ncbi:MAG: hypothetical protein AB7P40_02110 [Chloroflexota bacterium]